MAALGKKRSLYSQDIEWLESSRSSRSNLCKIMAGLAHRLPISAAKVKNMTITVSEEINAPRERIWNIITDIDTWADTIAGIVSIEVINRPETGIVGLKWKEKRVLFGREAVETMWITAAEPNSWYETKAENHGAIYSTRLSLDDSSGRVVLTMAFSAKATTIASKLMSVMSFMFNGTMRKMLQKDLTDIRRVAENS
jgi:uncharacterized membrane protein